MEIGIRSSSCINAGEIFALGDLAFLKDAGFNLVEFNFNHPERCPAYSDGEIWRKEAQKLSMRFTAHAPAFFITSLDTAEVENGVKEYKKMLDTVSIFGVESLIVHTCGGNSSFYPDRKNEHMANFIHALEKLAPKCEEHRINFLVETMIPGRLASMVDNLIVAVDAAGSEWIKICLDTNHSNLSEDVGQAITRAADRLGELHINDNHGEGEEHLLPYEGIIDWADFSRAVNLVGYDGDMILEPSWKAGKNAKDMVPKAFAVATRLREEICGKC